MYVRVKRGKTTYFVHVEPSVTILELKQKLQELTEKVGSSGLTGDSEVLLWLDSDLFVTTTPEYRCPSSKGF